jgi:mannose-6-phosphate isomerase
VLAPFKTVPSLRPRVWGGTRLTPPGSVPIGESWLVGPGSTLAGPGRGDLTLDDLVARHGVDLVGTDAPAGTGFPLLIKLLDPAEWLSVQVHPDDEQAVRLEGPGAVGKTEGWYFIEAAPEATILLGARPEASAQELLAGLQAGHVAHLLQRRHVQAGDACLVEAGTLHAVGPGVLVYEIQQASDITYRCDDWGRPATAGRALHTRQSIEVAHLGPWTGQVTSSVASAAEDVLLRCTKFVLEHTWASAGTWIERDTRRSSVHVLTGVSGPLIVQGQSWSESVDAGESLVIPAAVGAYRVAQGPGDAAELPERSLALVARLPGPAEVAGPSTPAHGLVA